MRRKKISEAKKIKKQMMKSGINTAEI